MKHIIIAVLLLVTLKAHAQNEVKADSAYYLLDTTKTLPSDKLWSTYVQGKVKFYELNVKNTCSSLLDKPTFVYSAIRTKSRVINIRDSKSIKKISLAELILQLANFAEEDKRIENASKKNFYLYIIEPQGSGYSLVRTLLDGSGKRTTTY